ncbi:MAG: hypothetical protein AB1452_00090 [Pseudomonadota bacterium]
MILRTALIALLLLLLSACTTVTKVGPGSVTVKDMQIALDGPWNRFESSALVLFQAPGATEIWTREGFTLDVLAFYFGIADGETIGMALPRTQKKMPQFRLRMTPHEIVEAFETVVTQDGSLFKLARLEPARFAGGEGFRFEYELKRKGDSLLFNGVGYGTVANQKLYLMAYSAPRTYYFPKLLPALEAAVRSATIKR